MLPLILFNSFFILYLEFSLRTFILYLRDFLGCLVHCRISMIYRFAISLNRVLRFIIANSDSLQSDSFVTRIARFVLPDNWNIFFERNVCRHRCNTYAISISLHKKKERQRLT